MQSSIKRHIFSGCILFLLSNILYAETDDKEQKRTDYIRSHYTKYEYQIPMRDGITLFTAVYVPTDDSQKYPILMKRTPYSVAPYGVNKYRTSLGPGGNFEKEGYIFVFQDVRGNICLKASTSICVRKMPTRKVAMQPTMRPIPMTLLTG